VHAHKNGTKDGHRQNDDLKARGAIRAARRKIFSRFQTLRRSNPAREPTPKGGTGGSPAAIPTASLNGACHRHENGPARKKIPGLASILLKRAYRTSGSPKWKQ